MVRQLGTCVLILLGFVPLARGGIEVAATSPSALHAIDGGEEVSVELNGPGGVTFVSRTRDTSAESWRTTLTDVPVDEILGVVAISGPSLPEAVAIRIPPLGAAQLLVIRSNAADPATQISLPIEYGLPTGSTLLSVDVPGGPAYLVVESVSGPAAEPSSLLIDLVTDMLVATAAGGVEATADLLDAGYELTSSADINGDGHVSFVDVEAVANALVDGYDSRFDLDASGDITVRDLELVIESHGDRTVFTLGDFDSAPSAEDAGAGLSPCALNLPAASVAEYGEILTFALPPDTFVVDAIYKSESWTVEHDEAGLFMQTGETLEVFSMGEGLYSFTVEAVTLDGVETSVCSTRIYPPMQSGCYVDWRISDDLPSYMPLARRFDDGTWRPGLGLSVVPVVNGIEQTYAGAQVSMGGASGDQMTPQLRGIDFIYPLPLDPGAVVELHTTTSWSCGEELDPAAASVTLEAAQVPVFGTQTPGDQDADGYWDDLELLAGSDPADQSSVPSSSADRDSDGLSDATECGPFGSSPVNSDSDFDGVSDATEHYLGFLPLAADSDSNGTPDVNEPAYIAIDTDLDGLHDALEHDIGTSHRLADTDSDGWSDGFELRGGSSPLSGSLTPVTSRALGMAEVLVDTDGDGLADILETGVFATDPAESDSDGDGVSDGDEFALERDPAVWDEASLDTDHDGISDYEEIAFGLDPSDRDTDGDGFDDLADSEFGFDPLLPNYEDLQDANLKLVPVHSATGDFYYSWLDLQISASVDPKTAGSTVDVLTQYPGGQAEIRSPSAHDGRLPGDERPHCTQCTNRGGIGAIFGTQDESESRYLRYGGASDICKGYLGQQGPRGLYFGRPFRIKISAKTHAVHRFMSNASSASVAFHGGFADYTILSERIAFSGDCDQTVLIREPSFDCNCVRRNYLEKCDHADHVDGFIPPCHASCVYPGNNPHCAESCGMQYNCNIGFPFTRRSAGLDIELVVLPMRNETSEAVNLAQIAFRRSPESDSDRAFLLAMNGCSSFGTSPSVFGYRPPVHPGLSGRDGFGATYRGLATGYAGADVRAAGFQQSEHIDVVLSDVALASLENVSIRFDYDGPTDAASVQAPLGVSSGSLPTHGFAWDHRYQIYAGRPAVRLPREADDRGGVILSGVEMPVSMFEDQLDGNRLRFSVHALGRSATWDGESIVVTLTHRREIATEDGEPPEVEEFSQSKVLRITALEMAMRRASAYVQGIIGDPWAEDWAGGTQLDALAVEAEDPFGSAAQIDALAADGASVAILTVVPSPEASGSERVYLSSVSSGDTDFAVLPWTGVVPPLPLTETERVAAAMAPVPLANGHALLVAPDRYAPFANCEQNELLGLTPGYAGLLSGPNRATVTSRSVALQIVDESILEVAWEDPQVEVPVALPPVVLVHGLFGDASEDYWPGAVWDHMGYGSRVLKVDYSDLNVQGIDQSVHRLNQTVLDAKRRARAGELGVRFDGNWPSHSLYGLRTECQRVRVVGHSMGGLLTRLAMSRLETEFHRQIHGNQTGIGPVDQLYPAMFKLTRHLDPSELGEHRALHYLRADNFGAGDFSTVVTIGTPYFGSPIANAFVASVRPERLPGKLLLRTRRGLWHIPDGPQSGGSNSALVDLAYGNILADLLGSGPDPIIWLGSPPPPNKRGYPPSRSLAPVGAISGRIPQGMRPDPWTPLGDDVVELLVDGYMLFVNGHPDSAQIPADVRERIAAEEAEQIRAVAERELLQTAVKASRMLGQSASDGVVLERSQLAGALPSVTYDARDSAFGFDMHKHSDTTPLLRGSSSVDPEGVVGENVSDQLCWIAFGLQFRCSGTPAVDHPFLQAVPPWSP